MNQKVDQVVHCFVGYVIVETPEIAMAIRIANEYGLSNATVVERSILIIIWGWKVRKDCNGRIDANI